MVTVNIVYCEKAKLVHTQDPDAAYHDGSAQCTHHNPIIALKHGKTWYIVNIIYCKNAKLVHTQVPSVYVLV